MGLTDEKVQSYGTGTTEEESTENFPGWMFWKKRRYVVATLAFFGFFNVYALRVNLSIAIVAMTKNRTITFENGTIIEIGPEFEWDSKIQGYILSSFFYGYITTQLFGGWLSARIGGKRVFGGGVAVTAALTLVTPWLARINVYLLLTVRIIEGIFEGVTYPCIHAVWSRWAPPLERSRLATLAFSGSYFGTVVSMPVCAYLANALGWPSIFYFFGALGLIWFGIWCVVVAESPAEDPKISKAELQYIKESLGDTNHHQIRHPWKQILTSMPVWAIVVSHFSENWGFYTLLTQLPKFMNEILHFNLGKTGFMAAIPYLAISIILQVAGHFADFLRERRIMTTTQVRKTFNCGAFIAQTVFMMAAAFWLSPVGTIVCLTLAVGLGGFAWSGFSVNHLDIAPQHASVLMGLGNTIATLPGIVSPIISGYIVTTPTAQEWQIVFYIASGVYLFGCIFYGTFASGELQPWAIEKEDLKETQMKERTTGHENKSFDPDF